jgi:hypothetical protein
VTLELARKRRDQGDLIDELVEALEMLWDYHGQRLDDAIPSALNAAEFSKKWPLTDAQMDAKVRAVLEKAKERR